MSAEANPNPLMVVSPRSRRRKVVGHIMEGICTAAALLAVAVLAIVIISVARKGLPALSVDFFTKSPAPIFQTGGGIANAIVGTIIMTAMATLIAVPMGILIAIFNVEFAPPQVSEFVRLALNVLAGVPTIVIGIFIFGLLVVGHGQSAIAASIGLSIVMVPLVARATEEVLALVPSTLREGGMALGATRARTVITVILPTAVGGIVTATIVAVARAAGETAPLLFTSSIFANTVVTNVHQAMASIPLTIYVDSEQPSVADQQTAWAAALVLMVGVLVAGIIGRALSLRTRRQIERAR
jgi:phosphate transport system permease protein